MTSTTSTLEPTEQEKDAIFSFVDSIEGKSEQEVYQALTENFEPHVVQWFTDTMAALIS